MAPPFQSARRVVVALWAPLLIAGIAACGNDDAPTGTGGRSPQLVFASDRDGNLEI